MSTIRAEGVDVLHLHNAAVMVEGDGIRFVPYHDSPLFFVNSYQAVELAQEILRRYDVKPA